VASGIDPNLPQLPYIVTDLFVAMNHSSSREAIDYHTLQLYSLIAHASRDDKEFKTEWEAIQADRCMESLKGYRQGGEGFEAMDLAFRMRERTCLSNAAQRNGIISRIPTPRTKWTGIQEPTP
jgi:hypothetical protein